MIARTNTIRCPKCNSPYCNGDCQNNLNINFKNQNTEISLNASGNIVIAGIAGVGVGIIIGFLIWKKK